MHSPLYIWWGEFGQQCILYVRVASTQLYYAIKYLNQRLRYRSLSRTPPICSRTSPIAQSNFVISFAIRKKCLLVQVDRNTHRYQLFCSLCFSCTNLKCWRNIARRNIFWMAQMAWAASKLLSQTAKFIQALVHFWRNSWYLLCGMTFLASIAFFVLWHLMCRTRVA